MFNPIIYVITKIRLFFAKNRAQAAKKAMNHMITHTRAAADEIDWYYNQFLCRVKEQERIAVKLKRLQNQYTDFAILKVKLDTGEIQQSEQAKELTKLDISTALTRHIHGDWGDLSRNQWIDNNTAVLEGRGIIRSRYRYHGGRVFFINTDILRKQTRICLEGE